ncbi:DUF2254 domain-containing protein [Microbacterium sp. KSW-18]|uniref:DUF2254 domain-containing protein n=1 Tax=Microbacterium aquilitoris TaxID=3067307 RepID=A0ABU3GEW3_9MICO|nr:DUF2254 domain-containing protein [Microbacterium sp. KSW-18]MDT3329230.1 DUF2254 domain-containing protein [Microbacterium sp. KSW-18]
MTTSLALLRRIMRTVWARAIAFTAVAVMFALAAGVVGSLIPFELRVELGQNSVDSLLQIIATAMLTATTFSITAMVTAYSSATTIATPRSTKLLIADPTSQNALSIFLGGFVFALVGIIALSTGYYTEQGRTILFFGTLVVIAIIVATLLRWIGHLARFGRMADVIDRVEDAATRTLVDYAKHPTLGARELRGVPAGASSVTAAAGGEYVLSVDVARLDALAEKHGCDLFVTAIPGTIADHRHPLAHVRGRVSEAIESGIRSAFVLGRHRDYDQDPRLGVIALAEIGSRALSPSTNDPGTAIEVIAALQRVFTAALDSREPDGQIDHPHVWIARPRVDELVTDAFRPLARDGAGFVEVQIRLQKCLRALRLTAPDDAVAFDRMAEESLRRAARHLSRAERRAVRAALS